MKGISQTTAKALIGSSILLTTAAQLLFRAGMKDSRAMVLLAEFDPAALMAWLATSDALMVAVGVIFYVLSLIAWLIALSRFEVSFAYPLLAITYILVYVAAIYWPLLGEQASPQKLLGITIIVAGVALVSVSRSEN